MAIRRLLGPLVVVAILVVSSPTRASGSIESQVFSMINGSRSSALVWHSGLAAAARMHSQQMAASGGLHHDGADERVNNASPDPVEGNGAPDDGFAVAAWCENVTYSTGFPESQVAQKLYQQWNRSASHRGCMTNSNKNVGAVGIYYDGSTWWATFIAEVDRTPPGGARPSQPSGTGVPRGESQPPPPRTQPRPADVQQPADRTPPAGSGPGAGAVEAPATGGTVVAIGDSPVSPVTTEVGQAPMSVAQALSILQEGRRSTRTSGPGYEIDVQPLPALKTLFRARRTGLPGTEPVEMASLAVVALLAFRRLDRRMRTKATRSWPHRRTLVARGL